jgi:receptor protein-tyrosine kinase
MSIIERALDRLDRLEDASKAPVSSAGVDSRIPSESGRQVQVSEDAERRSRASTDHAHVETSKPAAKSSRTVNLNLAGLSKAGILVPSSLNKRLIEEYRRIKRPILVKAFPEAGTAAVRNLVVVTSSVAGEGKSYTSLNLAMSVATEVDRTVLVIDADVVKQSLTARLELSGSVGLTDYLASEGSDLAEFLVRTNVANLVVLPAGRHNQKVTELWASDRMRSLMAELSSRYADRLVIFDSPPLLQDSSSAVLASMAGQVVVVIEAEKTPQHVVKEALTSIDDLSKVGLLLNKSNQRIGDGSRYGYGYY